MSSPILNLQVGEWIVSSEPAVVSARLGASIVVCLFTADGRGGGLVHYALPQASTAETESPRFGDSALKILIEQVKRLTGAPASQLQAKIAGGAGSGAANVAEAHAVLSRHGIAVIGEDTGGLRERKILFHLPGGRLQTAFAEGDSAAPSAKKGKTRVLIVDDSKTIRDLLTRVFQQSPDFEVVGQAEDPLRAELLLPTAKPDVITLDVHMPRMTGVQWLKTLVPKYKIPVVMITSLELKDGNEVFEALELGAVDYIQKPSLHDLRSVSEIIREKVLSAAGARVSAPLPRRKRSVIAAAAPFDSERVIAIGSSTGGTEALREVLTRLPKNIPPIVIVQHIPPVFSRAFADRMNSLCPFDVKEAESGDALHVNRVLIAPGGRQMKIVKRPSGLFVEINDDAPVNRHKPSVDYLFHSVAEILGRKAVGVILTGMGSDGAQGLLRMRERGAVTFSQDERSCVVYGMPKAAWEIGASQFQVGLDSVAERIVAVWGRPKASAS